MGYVLLTGATSGIGYELTKIFYKNGYSLILVGRSEEKLLKVKQELCQMKLQGQHGEILWIRQDLEKENVADEIFKQVQSWKIKVQILVNNAGAGYVGEFIEEDEKYIKAHMQLNMTTLTLLTRYFAEQMKEEGGGRILNVASTGSYHPGAYIAVYYATKAYVLSLSEALYEELKPYKIRVSSLCPGATKTNFSKAAGKSDSGIAMSAAFVAEQAYKGLMRGKKVIIPGIRNKLWVKMPKCIGIKLVKKYQKNLIIKK